MMLQKPLTSEEKQQKKEWTRLVFDSGSTLAISFMVLIVTEQLVLGPSQPLDIYDNEADALIAWSQGWGVTKVHDRVRIIVVVVRMPWFIHCTSLQ